MRPVSNNFEPKPNNSLNDDLLMIQLGIHLFQAQNNNAVMDAPVIDFHTRLQTPNPLIARKMPKVPEIRVEATEIRV